MTGVVPHTDVSWGVYEGGDWERHRDHGYTTGIIRTKLGLVYVYRQWDLDHPLTMLEIIYGGKVHRRQWETCYSERYCVTLAKRFIREHEVEDDTR
jgi:hypothetical protein